MTAQNIKMPNKEHLESNLYPKEKKLSISIYEVLNHEVDKKKSNTEMKKFLNAQIQKR